MFQSVFEGFESFLFVPNTTSRSGVHIHDSIDSKRTMIVVIIALLPAMLFGMYNVGYQLILVDILLRLFGSFTQNRRSIRSWIGNRVYRRPNTAS